MVFSINNRIELYYNAEKPDAAADWTMAFTLRRRGLKRPA
jgi:hypothetical protein